ncbi:hypothetical protein GYMLUDRAFT_239764 [Collybiopsis luxurians FD-317 M1]|nr:hypothetical protein GYMLUDRAFT_239764 [Collybiopsis luxurians FD-317 M1]
MFSSLPLELLDLIGNETARLQDRKSLRCTCSLFGIVFRPHVLAEVTLNIHADNLDPGISLLQVLAREFNSGSGGVSKLVRTLNIDSLSPAFPSKDSTFDIFLKRKSRSSLFASTAEKNLWLCFEPALKSLRNLNTLRWRWQSRESEWTRDVLLALLSTPSWCRNLKDCTIHNDSNGKIFIPSPLLRRLRVLSITGPVIPGIFSTRSPASRLETVRLFRKGPHLIPLNTAIPSTISSLGLDGWTIDVPKIIHNNLTSLHLGERIIYTNSDIVLDPHGHFRRETAYDSLWNTLSDKQVHLRSLAVAFKITGALLDYLQSYSGLENLSLMGHSIPTRRFEEVSLRNRFFERVLPMHEKTLLKLEIKPKYDDGWCFGPHNIEVFRRCRRLRCLLVGVDSHGLDDDSESLVNAEDYIDLSRHYPRMSPFFVNYLGASQNSVMISSSLPDMETVRIHAVGSTDTWGIATNRYSGIQRRLKASIKSFASEPLPNGARGNEVLKWVKVYVDNERVLVQNASKVERSLQQLASDEGWVVVDLAKINKDSSTNDEIAPEKKRRPVLHRVSQAVRRFSSRAKRARLYHWSN